MATLKTKPVQSTKKTRKNNASSTCSKPQDTLSYREGLDTTERARYDQKIMIIKGQDPYEIVTWSTDVKNLPNTTYMDIVNYLLFTTSAYTKEQLKCYKGLDAYNQFVCGWVRDTGHCVINDKILTTAKVLHSQRLNEKPLRPWIISEKDGQVLAAHCNCMAGLGETCTHVAALLFYMEAAVKIRDAKTVTETKAYWKMPTTFKNVSYEKLKNIDFSSASSLKRKFDESVNDGESYPAPTPAKRQNVTVTPNSHRLNAFLHSLSKAPSKPAVLSVIPKYCESYIPAVLQCDLPIVLTELKTDSAISMEYKELLDSCDLINIEVSAEQSSHVEAITREQSNSSTWFRFRAGRVTASVMKSVCRTDPNTPAQSLIKRVCYPESAKFTSKATTWGCNHEKVARDMFVERISECHDNIHIRNAGFVISSDHPHIGASPDAILTCDCCGSSPVEIKCPFCAKDSVLKEVKNKNFFLKEDSDGTLKLDRKHEHFYQIQTQLGVLGLERGFFVVWTEKDLHIEEILFDCEFWSDLCLKSKHFFKTAILPELVGKYYSKLNSVSDASTLDITDTLPKNKEISENVQNELWCYCQDIEHGNMVCCDNDTCKYQWFHYDCVRIRNEPKGKWYCPDCRKQ